MKSGLNIDRFESCQDYSAVVLFLLTLRILNEKLKGVSQVAEW
jgi:hypothetical protein